MRARIQTTKRKAHRTFLVICEGETERVYVETLKRHYRLPVAIRTKVSGSSINNRLVNQYLKELGLVDKDEYCIFYIYDSDVESIVNKLSCLEGNLILTNPCIELWFLLHTADHNRNTSSEALVKTLMNAHPVWKSYVKGHLSTEQSKLLLVNKGEAVRRAASLNKLSNPSSDMPVFIQSLENEKKD